MAVKIRLKKLGRRHRPFFRVCAMDGRVPRDGKVIEELGFYDPMVKETDARAVLNGERIDYWLGVGAQPSENVKTLIKKYGSNGTHLEQQKSALERLKQQRPVAPVPVPQTSTAAPAETEEESPAEETVSQDAESTEETAGETAEQSE